MNRVSTICQSQNDRHSKSLYLQGKSPPMVELGEEVSTMSDRHSKSLYLQGKSAQKHPKNGTVNQFRQNRVSTQTLTDMTDKDKKVQKPP